MESLWGGGATQPFLREAERGGVNEKVNTRKEGKL